MSEPAPSEGSLVVHRVSALLRRVHGLGEEVPHPVRGELDRRLDRLAWRRTGHVAGGDRVQERVDDVGIELRAGAGAQLLGGGLRGEGAR